MSKLDFSIAINLLTENFKKGANEVKSMLEQVQSHVLAMASVFGIGGFALTSFVAKILAASKETAKANMVLRNVSTGALDFANNLKFSNQMAMKYGLYVNDISANLAKFTVSARTSNISMSDQHKIFESVIRAGNSFGLTGEQTSSVFENIEKSMRKGTISARDFRGELGTQIPVAMQAMAMATGVSLAKLNDMAKKGQLLSKDVWPKFAEALTKLTPNINTDTIAANLGRLKNTFTNAANSPTFLKAYNKAIKEVISLLQYASTNIKTIITELVSFIIGTQLGKLFSWITIQLAKSQRQAMTAARAAAREAGVQFDAVKWKAESASVTISTAFKRAGAAIKTAFMSALPTVILVIISEIIGRLYELHAEAERIKNIQNEYQQGLFNATHTPEIEQLKQLQTQYNKARGNLDAQRKIREQIGNLVGYQITAEENVNKIISDRIGLMQRIAASEYFTQSKISSEDEMNQIIAKYGGAKNFNALRSQIRKRYGNTDTDALSNAKRLGDRVYPNGDPNPGFNPAVTFSGYNVNTLMEDMNNYNTLAAKRYLANTGLNKVGVVSSQYPTMKNTPDAGTKKESELDKIEDNYIASLRDLTERRKLEKMSENEYNKNLDKLNSETWLNIVSLGDSKAANSEFAKARKHDAYNPLFSQAQEDYEKAQKDYDDGLNKLGIQLAEGYITRQQYDDSLQELQQKVVDEISSTEGLTQAQKDNIKTLQKEATPNIQDVINKAPTRNMETSRTNNDPTFDYKKTKAEIAEAQLDEYKKDVDYYQQQIDKAKELKGISLDYINQLNDKLTEAQKTVTKISQAVKIQQIKNDIKDLNKSLTGLDSGFGSAGLNGTYAKIETIKDGFVDLQGTIAGLHQTFSKSGDYWNKFMTVLESSFSIFDSLANTIQKFEEIEKTIRSLVGATQALDTANKASASIDTAVTGTKVANAATGATADTTATGVQVANAATKVKANTAVAASGAAASVAGIPIVGIGLAVAGVAVILAMMNKLPKFATGGIVGGGSTSGDNVLTRLNSGEMVLNNGQQSKLFNLVNSGQINNAGGVLESHVTTDVKMDKLIIGMNNRLRLKGKPLIGQ